MLILPIVMAALHAATPSLDQTQTSALTSESLILSTSAVALQDEEAEEILTEDKWSGGITGMLAVSDGNTRRKAGSITADAIKDYVNKDRWTTSLFWTFTQENQGGVSAITQRKAGIRTQYDSALDENTYWYVNASADTDVQAALDLRWTAGVGLGHIFRDDAEWRFAGEVGLTYVDEEFATGQTSDFVAARLAYRANWHYSENLEFAQVTEIFPSLDEADDIYGRMDTRATYQMTANMIAQLQWVWDWDNTPATGLNRSDNLYLATIGWTF